MPTSEFRYVTTSIYQPVYTVTNAVGNGSTITYTAVNSFTVGQLVTTSGISPSQYNKTDAVITARTNTTFTISSGSTGTFVSGGTATAYNSVLAELPFTGVNFTQQLNSVGTFQGHVLLSGLNSTGLNVYDGTIPGKTILWVLYTNTTSGTTTPVWSGVIWNREYDSVNQTLMISAQEMMSLYQKRRISTNKTYTAQDPTVIAKSLMVYAEGKGHGNTGLNYATVPSTGLSSTRTYNAYEYKTVYQAVKDLAQNYFDFKIAAYINNGFLVNKYTMGVPLGVVYSGTNLNATVLQFPGNIVEYRFPEDATSAANTLYGLGYGANGNKIIATAIDGSKINTGDWPLLEDSANYIDISDVSLLQNTTLGQLNAISYPPTTVEVVIPIYNDPYYPSYSIGDEVRLDIQDDYFPAGLPGLILRIVAISVNPGENGPSNATLTLTRQLAAGSVS